MLMLLKHERELPDDQMELIDLDTPAGFKQIPISSQEVTLYDELCIIHWETGTVIHDYIAREECSGHAVRNGSC